MSDGVSKQFPYRTLGYQLRNLREKNDQTLSEVSGAVEIEADALKKIEKGSVLPSEDILLLLISHFGLQNEAAMKLWRLAGYDKYIDTTATDNSVLAQQSAVLLLPIDARIIYSDSVKVSKNNYGVVMNFMQSNDQKDDQPLPIARVGMSKEHAKEVITKLQNAIADQENTKQKMFRRQNPKTNKPSSKKTKNG